MNRMTTMGRGRKRAKCGSVRDRSSDNGEEVSVGLEKKVLSGFVVRAIRMVLRPCGPWPPCVDSTCNANLPFKNLISLAFGTIRPSRRRHRYPIRWFWKSEMIGKMLCMVLDFSS